MNNLLKLFLFLFCSLLGTVQTFSQGFPDQWYLNPNTHILEMGKIPLTGLYKDSVVRNIDLDFYGVSNYWNLLIQNYASKTNIPARLTYEGTTILDSVGVRFKGNTSYMGVSNSQKKSFNLELDWKVSNQDISGYSTLNLNNAFEDRSFMREFIYGQLASKHIPAVKTGFVHLTLNGQDWGLYPNVQQINRDFYKDWFTSNNGINWRADKPAGSTGPGPGPGPGPGANWGDGTAALNYRGTTDTAYSNYYTLKYNDISVNPWDDLELVCDKLNNVPLANLMDSIDKYMDLDRTLWFLATEIAFTDDDSYVYKGKMDYYLFKEAATGRMVPQEFDGNSPMDIAKATSWSPFYNETKVNYPLLNRLLQVPEIRQRYLAHFRTILKDEFDQTAFNNEIDYYKNLVDAIVVADPKKLYTYQQFISEIQVLKDFMNNRRNYLQNNTEMAQMAPVINAVSHFVNNVQWDRPTDLQMVQVKADLQSTVNLQQVNLYFSGGINGRFIQTQMYDDGQHNDGAANDGTFGADIPAFPGGTWVRYYVEAVGNNTVHSVSYMPEGAEHDVFVYLVYPNNSTQNDVVINEFMASNTTAVQDNFGEYDDWIELYNNSAQSVDLSDYVLTNDALDLSKFQIAPGTIMPGNSYMIFWADKDGSQGTNHCNFKLSASGGELILLNNNGQVINDILYSQQVTDSGYARIPNGTGGFIVKYQTFGLNNETPAGLRDVKTELFDMVLYPNPSKNILYLKTENTLNGNDRVDIYDMTGKKVISTLADNQMEINIDHLSAGVYILKLNNSVKNFVKQ